MAVSGNIISVEFHHRVMQNEVAFVVFGDERLKSEVVRVEGNRAELQVFEETRGLKVGDFVAFSGELLSARLGPGLLSQIYDGLQNPLPDMAEKFGFFLPKGVSLDPLDTHRGWGFEPAVKEGDLLVTSNISGYAMVNNDPTPGTVIAQALEDFKEEHGLIKAMIRKF